MMKYFLPLLSSFFIFGCNKIEFGYKQVAPRVVINRLDDSFDFKSDRFNQIRLQVDSDFKKNQKDVAKAVHKNLDELLVLSESKNLAATDFNKNFESLHATQKYLIDLFKPSFEEVLNSLSKEEFDHLNNFSKEKFTEAEKLISNKEDYFEKQISSFENVMDFLFDSSTDEQVRLYKKFLEDNYSFSVYQVDVRRRFMQNFEAKLPTKDQLIDYTLKYYSGDPSIRLPEHEKKQQAFLNFFFELEYQIWKSTNDKQKIFFKKKIDSLIEEFSKLEK
ncbi:MAG: hypothetical protein H7256_04610 [Bdellovibrio sp.]|nr:hypothetical protein [Bdellovibrio sp.]